VKTSVTAAVPIPAPASLKLLMTADTRHAAAATRRPGSFSSG
jgi:hypothetical protein